MIARHRFNRDDVALHYLVAGAGAPLVLVHGGGSRADHFLPLIPRLATRFCVYAYDQRGFGETGCAGGPAIDHQLWAEDLAAFIGEVVGEAAYVCGWSLGATVALNAASQQPERVRGLALLGAPNPDRPIDRAFFQRRVAEFRSGKPAEAIVEGVMAHVGAMFSPASLAQRPDALDTLRQEQLVNLACAEPVTRAYETRPDFGPMLPLVRCPTTLIVGEQDRTCDLAGARILQSRLAHCAVVTIPDCGHYYALEQPEAVASAIIAACA